MQWLKFQYLKTRVLHIVKTSCCCVVKVGKVELLKTALRQIKLIDHLCGQNQSFADEPFPETVLDILTTHVSLSDV